MQIVLPDNELATALPVILPATGVGEDAAGIYPSSYAPAAPVSNTLLPNGARLVEFDSAAWLSECSDRLADYDENDRGKVIGALLGAAAGGFAGNRLADGNRFAGTALGAGTGALAGAAIGDSIDDHADRRAGERSRANADSYCAAYLDDYLTRASNHAGHGTAYVPGQQYMLVPVSVPVARQVEYRDVVPAGN
ncbi:MAG: glycine zipper 2TM domain-containing protein [Erythrobacter sp.]|nr:glycine zipper 2TM domain-containing protein [Erythrobacter sp.]